MRATSLLAAFTLALASGSALAQAPAPRPPAPPPAAPATPAEAPDPVVARVGGEEIRGSDLAEAAQGLPEELRGMPPNTLYPLLLDQQIDRKILVLAARKAGLPNDPAVQRQVARATETALQNALLLRQVGPGLTEEAIRARYERDVAGKPGEEQEGQHEQAGGGGGEGGGGGGVAGHDPVGHHEDDRGAEEIVVEGAEELRREERQESSCAEQAERWGHMGGCRAWPGVAIAPP